MPKTREIKTIITKEQFWGNLYKKYDFVPDPVYNNLSPKYYSVISASVDFYQQPNYLQPIQKEDWLGSVEMGELKQLEKFKRGLYWLAISGSVPMYHDGKEFHSNWHGEPPSNVEFWYEFKVMEK